MPKRSRATADPHSSVPRMTLQHFALAMTHATSSGGAACWVTRVASCVRARSGHVSETVHARCFARVVSWKWVVDRRAISHVHHAARLLSPRGPALRHASPDAARLQSLPPGRHASPARAGSASAVKHGSICRSQFFPDPHCSPCEQEVSHAAAKNVVHAATGPIDALDVYAAMAAQIEVGA